MTYFRRIGGLPAAVLARGGAAAARIWLALARPQQLRRAGVRGRLKPSTGGLLGVVIDIGWGLFGGVMTRLVQRRTARGPFRLLLTDAIYPDILLIEIRQKET